MTLCEFVDKPGDFGETNRLHVHVRRVACSFVSRNLVKQHSTKRQNSKENYVHS